MCSVRQAVILAVVVVFSFLITGIVGEKSLFDELPLNGAFVHPGQTVEEEVYSSPAAEASLSSTRRRMSPEKGAEKRQDDGQNQSSIVEDNKSNPTMKSLFDELPNQGAMLPPRSRRDSLVDFDVTPIQPSQEFDIPYWDNRLLTPIINSISRPQRPFRLPFSGNHHNHNGPQRGPPPPPRPSSSYHNHHHQNNRNLQYGPPPPPPPSKAFAFNYNKHNHHHHNNPFPAQPQRQVEVVESHHHPKVTANSGGPTVIVYAHPKKEISPGSGGWNNEEITTKTTTTTSTAVPPVKNEIHYHYHVAKVPDEVSTTTTPPTADEGYSYPAPSSYYRQTPQPPPSRNNNYNNNNDKPQGPPNADDDDFSRRTFFSVHSKRPPPPQQAPSTSYEVPPSPNAPSNSYHNNGHHHHPSSSLDTSYGPPPPTSSPPQLVTESQPVLPPAPPPPPQDAGADQYETTISLQTIPVTRTVTELVQVPNVVHKVSSSRPVAPVSNDQTIASLDESGGSGSYFPSNNPPSSAYGAPPPAPPRKQMSNQQQQQLNLMMRGQQQQQQQQIRPFESHLEQILGPTQSPKDTLLQELLLAQARNPGSSYDLTLSDLEVLSLLQQSSRGSGGGGLAGTQVPILNPGRNAFSGLFGGRGLFGGSGRGLNSVGNSGGGGGGGIASTLTSLFSGGGSDSSSSSGGLGGIREAFREQRFQLALQDLRKQLREQGRENVRERSSYRSLLTKGALLLSALTLLPSVVNPMASAAGVGSASFAASSLMPNFMLPVTAAGRRRRRRDTRGESQEETEFEKCLKQQAKVGISGNSTTKNKHGRWMGCSDNLRLEELQETNVKRKNGNDPLLGIKADLAKFIPPEELLQASGCIQKEFCKSIRNLEKELPDNKLTLGMLYSLLQANDVKDNPWIQEVIRAHSDKKCGLFECRR